MSFARNGSGGGSGPGSSRSGHGAGHVRFESLVKGYCKQVVKEIVKEFNENIEVIYAQLSWLGKGWELMQKTMEGLRMDVLSVQKKVDNIEIKVETATIGVLKEVFKVGNSSAINVDNVEEVVARALEEGEDVVVVATRALEEDKDVVVVAAKALEEDEDDVVAAAGFKKKKRLKRRN